MASEIKVDTISEKTSANGVSIDSVVHKDSAVYPSSADGGALGSASNEWSDLFLADSSVIKFGADQDTTLTHTDGTGLTLNSTNKLCFNDASQFVQGSSNAILSLGATDEIDLTATAIDINGTCDISGTFSLGGTTVGSTAAELNFLDGSAKSTSSITVADADGIIIIDGTTTKQIPASDLKTYAGFTVSSITGATALAVQPASDDEIIINDGGALKRLDITHIQNVPAFYAYADGNSTISDNTWTKVEFDAEDLDTDSAYDNSTNFRFTPAVAGKYIFYTQVNVFGGATTVNYSQVAIYKNGSSHVQFYEDYQSNPIYGSNVGGTCIIDSDADDYFEVFARTDLTTGSPAIQGHGGRVTYFAAQRLTGV